MTPVNQPAPAGLPEPIVTLLDPRAYPHPVDAVELIQTHISYVLLAGEYVYKIRKPVDFGFLDFSTLGKRLADCRREIALNRRLCPSLYLGVVPVRFDSRRYTLDGPGRVVEYAVRMHRLPQDRMMDNLLAAGELTAEMVGALAERIAAFHRTPGGPVINRYGAPGVIRRNWEENFEQTAPYVGRTIAPEQYCFLRDWVEATLRRERLRFLGRIAAGRIRDGHGDLRTSAVCYVDGICIFDCIEFNRRMRFADVASDVAFMKMDLDARGRPDLADAFVARYVAASGDDGLAALLPFYACYRAFVRGKVDGFRLDEPEVGEAARAEAADAARRRFAQACRYAAEQPVPLLLVVGGLSGTGKSALAALLASELDAEIVSSDIVRKDLAGIAPETHRPEAFGAGLYSPRFTARTYAEMVRRAGSLLAEDRSVILDATFSSRRRREQARQAALRAGAHFFCVECVASEEIVRERLARRERDPRHISDARWETYLAQRATFEPLDEMDDWRRVVVDMDQPLDRCFADTMAALRPRRGLTWASG